MLKRTAVVLAGMATFATVTAGPASAATNATAGSVSVSAVCVDGTPSLQMPGYVMPGFDQLVPFFNNEFVFIDAWVYQWVQHQNGTWGWTSSPIASSSTLSQVFTVGPALNLANALTISVPVEAYYIIGVNVNFANANGTRSGYNVFRWTAPCRVNSTDIGINIVDY